MAEQIRIHGAREMEAVLKQLPDYIAKRVVTGALRKAAEPVLEEAQRRSPVGKESKGRVRVRTTKKGKISVSNYGKLKLSWRIVNVPAKRTAHSATVVVTPGKAFWGLFEEFGTRFRKKPLKPILRPAFEAKKHEALDRLGQALGDGLEKAAAKLAGPYLKSGLKRK
jgi:HK97 gp10 family phage protein